MNFARAHAATPLVTIQSDLFGAISVGADEVVRFEAGLLGFPECHGFVLLPAAREGLYWLQSVDHAPLAFLLADPFRFFPGYGVDLTQYDRAELEVTEASDVAVLSIVTLPRAGEAHATTNLQGPLALNLSSGKAKQLVLSDSTFGLRCEIDFERTDG